MAKIIFIEEEGDGEGKNAGFLGLNEKKFYGEKVNGLKFMLLLFS